MNTDWPTTRRFPRSLLEAFPQDHAGAVECYRQPLGSAGWIVGVVLGILGAVALVHFLAQ